MESTLSDKFLKFLDGVIENTITDIHISSGSSPYVRVSNRDVKPIEEFGTLTYAQVIDLIIYMNPHIDQEKIEHITTYQHDHKSIYCFKILPQVSKDIVAC